MSAPDYKIFLELMRCAKWIDTIYNRALKTEGLTVTQYETLLCLIDGGPLKQIEIVGRLGSDSGSLPRLLDRLERDGFAKRVPNKADARSFLIEITGDGNRKMARVLDKVRRVTKDLTQELSEKDFAAFTDGLNKIMKSAREIRQ